MDSTTTMTVPPWLGRTSPAAAAPWFSFIFHYYRFHVVKHGYGNRHGNVDVVVILLQLLMMW
jgi:hypothetical protein